MGDLAVCHFAFEKTSVPAFLILSGLDDQINCEANTKCKHYVAQIRVNLFSYLIQVISYYSKTNIPDSGSDKSEKNKIAKIHF